MAQRLINILGTIYNTKKRMKAVLETESDDFLEYATLIHNLLAKLYNDAYTEAYTQGYDDAFVFYFGEHPVNPGTTLPPLDYNEYEPTPETFTDARGQATITDLVRIQEELRLARLDMKEELFTNSNDFTTYPDILTSLKISMPTNGHDLGYQAGWAAVAGLLDYTPTITYVENTVTITCDLPPIVPGGESYIMYYFNDDTSNLYIYSEPFTINSSRYVNAYIKIVFNEQVLEGPTERVYCEYVPAPVVSVEDNYLFVNASNPYYCIGQSYDSSNESQYSRPVQIYNDGYFTVRNYNLNKSAYSPAVTVQATYLQLEELHFIVEVLSGSGVIKQIPVINNVGDVVSVNGEAWSSLDVNRVYYTGDIIRIKALDTYSFSASHPLNQIKFNGDFTVSLKGNLYSLTSVDFTNHHGLSEEFMSMFIPSEISNQDTNSSSIVNASQLIIKDNIQLTNINDRTADSIFYKLFADCSALTHGPQIVMNGDIPNFGFYQSFKGCNNMSNIVFNHSGFNVYDAGCEEMFKDCSSLINDQIAIGATSLHYQAYKSMFENCTALTNTPAIPNADLIHNGGDLGHYAYKAMFKGCTSLISASVIETETLVDGALDEMFRNCSNLSEIYIKSYQYYYQGTTSNITSSMSIYGQNMIVGCNRTGIFYKDSRADLSGISWTGTGQYSWTQRNYF